MNTLRRGIQTLPYAKIYKDKLTVVVEKFDKNKYFKDFSKVMFQAYEKGDGFTKEEVSDESLQKAVGGEIRFA